MMLTDTAAFTLLKGVILHRAAESLLTVNIIN